MNKQKVGMIIFFIGVLLSIIMGAVASWDIDAKFRVSTMEEVNQTMWKIPGFWFFLWALGTPLGMVIAGIGAMMHAKVKPLKIWLFGIGISLLAVGIPRALERIYYPPLFGIGGTLILLFFFGIVWLWAKNPNKTVGANIKLVGYTILAIAMWYLCGALSQPHLKAIAVSKANPTDEMIFLVFGWLFLFIGHYKDSKT